jgi:hypothetical protein
MEEYRRCMRMERERYCLVMESKGKFCLMDIPLFSSVIMILSSSCQITLSFITFMRPKPPRPLSIMVLMYYISYFYIYNLYLIIIYLYIIFYRSIGLVIINLKFIILMAIKKLDSVIILKSIFIILARK